MVAATGLGMRIVSWLQAKTITDNVKRILHPEKPQNLKLRKTTWLRRFGVYKAFLPSSATGMSQSSPLGLIIGNLAVIIYLFSKGLPWIRQPNLTSLSLFLLK